MVAVLIGGIVYMIIGARNFEKERIKLFKEFPSIEIKDEINDHVLEVRKDFHPKQPKDFIGKIGNKKCHMFFDPTRFEFSGLIVGDSISKQADTNLITVYRGQTVFKLRIQEE
jgi:hypothetical protein